MHFTITLKNFNPDCILYYLNFWTKIECSQSDVLIENILDKYLEGDPVVSMLIFFTNFWIPSNYT